MQFAASDMGWRPLADSVIHNVIGLGLPEAILTLYPQADVAERLLLREYYVAHFLRLDKKKVSDLFPRVLETLAALRDQGHLLAIATGKSRKGLDGVLAVHGLNDFFDSTRCADETASKPSPLMLQELLLEFDVPVQGAVMIGDTEYDMEMALQLGMPRIAVSYGAHNAERLHPYMPELCVDKIDEILSWHRINLSAVNF